MRFWAVSYTHLDVYKRQPYMAMYEKRPPREITEIINFPISAEVKFNRTKFYNNAVERAQKLRIKYKKLQPKVIKYEVGDRVPVSYTHLKYGVIKGRI